MTLLDGVPAGWRTLTRDSQEDAAWASVYRSFDVISPWTVTAMFKLATTAEAVPADASIVTLDADGEALPSDWYLQLSREAQVRLQRIGVVGTGVKGGY